MNRRWLLLVALVPMVEIYLLIAVGSWIGVLPTVLLLLLDAMLGIYLLQRQGLVILSQILFAQGQLPTQEVLAGMFILLGGILLLAPGFVTDLLGVFCLLPASRRYLVGRFIYSRSSATLEGEFRREDD